MRGQKSKERRERQLVEKEPLQTEAENAIVVMIEDYAALLDLVMPWVEQYDGSEEGKLLFIEKCNQYGLTTRQMVDASWILYDHMSQRARTKENERNLRCGKPAHKIFGEFDPNHNGEHELIVFSDKG